MKNKILVTEVIDITGLTSWEAGQIYQDMKKTRKYTGLKSRILKGGKLEVTYWRKK